MNSRAADPVHHLPPNPWLIAAVVALAAFMEILDTSIANVALPYMAGNLGVSNDESTWVLTSYLVSNAIILPVSGWIAGLVGRKRLFMGCIAGCVQIDDLEVGWSHHASGLRANRGTNGFAAFGI